MKLIIKEYFASLRERGELDAILPDLLSQMGLNVFSRPARGTRQDGVDVGAVGDMEGNAVEKVYLFPIKSGDLSRTAWDGDAIQALRPSLNEILDVYISHRLPREHQGKPIVICITVGGEILEQVRPQLEGFIAQNKNPLVTFEQWNGDKLAALVEANFLSEDLLPGPLRSSLRRSLAMLDEPDVSYQHFVALIRSLSALESQKDAERVRALRQIGICLGMLFSWGRTGSNLESTYRCGELALLHAWKIASYYVGKSSAVSEAVKSAFSWILTTYQRITSEYLARVVMPHVGKRHGLSTGVMSSEALDVNLKLFDVIGRLGIEGVWTYWGISNIADEKSEVKQRLRVELGEIASSIKELIVNNPALFLPAKDSQVIDLTIAALVLVVDPANVVELNALFTEIVNRAIAAYQLHRAYPCTIEAYAELLEHPQASDRAYREQVTRASVLYPTVALFAALFDLDALFARISQFKSNELAHCSFQFWYPDDTSETHFYTNTEAHGATLVDVPVDQSKEELLNLAFGECQHSPHFRELSAVSRNLWPLIVVACRHYRLPLPIHLLEGLRKRSPASQPGEAFGGPG